MTFKSRVLSIDQVWPGPIWLTIGIYFHADRLVVAELHRIRDVLQQYRCMRIPKIQKT